MNAVNQYSKLILSIDPKCKADNTLNIIILKIENYLSKINKSFISKVLYRKINCSYHQSWYQIKNYLRKFIISPAKTYTRIMILLDKERLKYSDRSKFKKMLNKLSSFLSSGPIFSNKINFTLHSGYCYQ